MNIVKYDVGLDQLSGAHLCNVILTYIYNMINITAAWTVDWEFVYTARDPSLPLPPPLPPLPPLPRSHLGALWLPLRRLWTPLGGL